MVEYTVRVGVANMYVEVGVDNVMMENNQMYNVSLFKE